MIRTLRALPPLLLLPVLLTTGCGTEKAGAGAGSGGAAAPADPAQLKSRAQALGIAPELVYVTGSPGWLSRPPTGPGSALKGRGEPRDQPQQRL